MSSKGQQKYELLPLEQVKERHHNVLQNASCCLATTDYFDDILMPFKKNYSLPVNYR